MVRFPHRHWQRFIALDFGIRCTIFVSTAVGIIVLLTTVQFVSYLHNVNGLAENETKAYALTMYFIVAATVLELMNAYLMNTWYFRPQGLNVRDQTIHCFNLKDFALQTTVVIAILFINPIFAFTTGVSGLKG